MKFRVDKGTGYMYSYNPNHPSSNGAGKIMQHVYVVEQSLGRRLTSEECVHHKDRDRKNNCLSNLQLMTHSAHHKLHRDEDRGYPLIEVEVSCKGCSKTFKKVNTDSKIYCTSKCSVFYSRKFNPTREELEDLVWSKPATKVAKHYGVSDVAVAKRCKMLGISKPPRGYWMKVISGAIKLGDRV